jgi:putative ABC transport system ATP-binding protein
VIRLRDLQRHFDVGDEVVHALDGIDEHIRAGEHVAIMGPSGSGKSTLLNLLGCLDRPTGGSYVLDGEPVESLSDRELTRVRRHKIGFVFQSFHLVPRLSAVENVELPMVFAGLGRGERRRRAVAALESVALGHRHDHRPDQLSGGERQRVAVARATVLGPRILLADEPTGNLDTRSGHQVLSLLHRLHADGLTLVVVTHDPAVARQAERVVVLRDGKVILRVPSEEIHRVVELISAVDGEPAEPPGDEPAEDEP